MNGEVMSGINCKESMVYGTQIFAEPEAKY
jgi:hypothetical protein